MNLAGPYQFLNTLILRQRKVVRNNWMINFKKTRGLYKKESSIALKLLK